MQSYLRPTSHVLAREHSLIGASVLANRQVLFSASPGEEPVIASVLLTRLLDPRRSLRLLRGPRDPAAAEHQEARKIRVQPAGTLLTELICSVDQVATQLGQATGEVDHRRLNGKGALQARLR